MIRQQNGKIVTGVLVCLVLVWSMLMSRTVELTTAQKIYTEKELIPKRYEASSLQIFLNKGFGNRFFNSKRCFVYRCTTDRPFVLLSNYPLAYVVTTVQKGSYFFGTPFGTRIYTRISDSLGEVYFDQKDVQKIKYPPQ